MLGTNLHLGDFRLGFLKRWRGNRLGQISPLMFGLLWWFWVDFESSGVFIEEHTEPCFAIWDSICLSLWRNLFSKADLTITWMLTHAWMVLQTWHICSWIEPIEAILLSYSKPSLKVSCHYSWKITYKQREKHLQQSFPGSSLYGIQLQSFRNSL